MRASTAYSKACLIYIPYIILQDSVCYYGFTEAREIGLNGFSLVGGFFSVNRYWLFLAYDEFRMSVEESLWPVRTNDRRFSNALMRASKDTVGSGAYH